MKELTRQDARGRLRDAGLRATAPRVAVLRLLAESERPLSHGEVVDAFPEGDWDQATLYRNLVALAEAGLARVASQVGGVVRYVVQDGEADAHLHPHFSCRECGDVQCLPGMGLTPPTDPRWREALQDVDLQVVGRCPGCRRPRRGASKRTK